MLEAEWEFHSNPWPMLDCVRSASTDRKAWLFAIACCRRVAPLLRNQGDRALIELTEERADSKLSMDEWLDAVFQAESVTEPSGVAGMNPADRAAFAVGHLLLPDA